MPRPIYKTALVGRDGSLPSHVSQSIRDHLKLFAGRTVEISIKAPKRSKQANAYYWGVVIATIRKALSDSGRDVSAEDLHEAFKHRYLDPRTTDVLGRSVTLPPSTANLDSVSFFQYLERIKHDEDVLALGCFIPDPQGGITSWAISEL